MLSFMKELLVVTPVQNIEEIPDKIEEEMSLE
jgi:hypothetical protein